MVRKPGEKIQQHFLGNFAVYSWGYSFSLVCGTLVRQHEPSRTHMLLHGTGLAAGTTPAPPGLLGQEQGHLCSRAGLTGGCSGGDPRPRGRQGGSSCGPGRRSRCSAAALLRRAARPKKRIWHFTAVLDFFFFFSPAFRTAPSSGLCEYYCPPEELPAQRVRSRSRWWRSGGAAASLAPAARGCCGPAPGMLPSGPGDAVGRPGGFLASNSAKGLSASTSRQPAAGLAAPCVPHPQGNCGDFHHGIIECVELEGALKIIQFPPRAMGRDTSH